MKRRSARKSRPVQGPFRRGLAWLARWTFRGALAWVLVTALLVVPLRWVDPPASAFMLQYRVTGDTPVRYQWVPRESISPNLALAVIAAEDQNFPRHRGFDAPEIRRAIQDHREGKRLRGASTITQQLARNLYLWPQRSWLRKGLEFWFTGWLEVSLPKSRILELYLNMIELGEGIYGAEAGSQHHFQIPASDLGREQAALLAGVLPAPKSLDASDPDTYLGQRQQWILGQMANLGTGWVPVD